MDAYFSNRVECLYEKLKDKLFFSEKSPFSKRLIIVQSPFMKSWLMAKMADELGIACGFEVLYPEQSIKRLAKRAPTPSALELALKLEVEMEAIHEKTEMWRPLLEFLEKKSRLTPFADTLAALFVNYAKYGKQMTKSEEWQNALWFRVMDTHTLEPKEEDVELHVFAVSHLPRLYGDFYRQIGASFYQLSPCQMFWGDVLSDKERSRLERFWQKQGASQASVEALDQFLRDCNPLLANFGRMGREMVKQIEEGEGMYALSSAVAEAYSPFLTGEERVYEKKELTLLEALQADMLFLRNPENEEQLAIAEKEPSIQVHVATSRLREVEILYNNLLHFVESKKGTLNPGDLLVMAPNIAEYQPFIESVFGREGSKLSYQVNDVALATQDKGVQGVLHLLSLPFGRFEATQLMTLLENPHFQQRQGFSAEDVVLIQKWMEEAVVYWGMDGEHRNEVLKRDGCRFEMEEDSSVGTWEHAFSRLLRTLVTEDPQLEAVDTAQAELLGKWIYVVRQLYKDLTPLTDDTKWTLSKWCSYLKTMSTTYFTLNNEHPIFDCLAKLECEIDTPFPFTTVRYHLEKELCNQQVSFRETALNSVRFCSLFPMRAIPAKVIALLGMQESAFLRSEDPLSFDLLRRDPNSDYCPTQTDYDRYLFLEALLSAREKLLISYQGVSESDGQQLAPSLLVTELLDYCQRAFSYEGKALVAKHPIDAFDKRYFIEGSGLKSYIPEHYAEALAYARGKKGRPHAFIPSFSIHTAPALEKEEIDIDKLAQFAKNPLRSYFKQALGMSLYEVESSLTPDDEPFTLNPLQLYHLKNRAAEKSPNEVFLQAKQEGKVPLGTFHTLAFEKFRHEIEKMEEAKRALGVKRSVTLHLTKECEKPELQEGDIWRVPPLHLEKGMAIVGTLSGVTEEGLLLPVKDDRIDCTKAWPQYLLFHALCERYALPCKPDLLFLKSGKRKEPCFSKAPLETYLEYYFLACCNASPLIPEWTYPIVTLPVEEAVQVIKKQLQDPFRPLYNPYIAFAMQEESLFANKEALQQWKGVAQQTFGALYDTWYPEGKR